jgi:cell fate (sporulation/competence/biofilm development) regulator YlbF (YheA/YmcA/DUF963 family)
MNTADAAQIPETVDTLKEAAEYAVTRQSVEAFEAFEKQLNELQALVRELQQSMWQTEARQAIKRLESNQPLMPEDLNVIRTFLVSDALHYLANEKNYRDWLAELRRLLEEIALRATDIARDRVGDLRGLLEDAIRQVPSIRNYLEEKQRVERFEMAMKSMDRTTRDLLVKVLAEQLSSSKR